MSQSFNFSEYEHLAARTRNQTEGGREQAVLNAALGLAGEAGETVDHIKKEIFHKKTLDGIELLHELGDTLYYLTWLANLYGYSLDEVASENIFKLQKRYPEGFKTVSERYGLA